MSICIAPIERSLGDSLEVGMTHLFYGDSQINEDLVRFAVEAQLPRKGELESPTIIIHSYNIV